MPAFINSVIILANSRSSFAAKEELKKERKSKLEETSFFPSLLHLNQCPALSSYYKNHNFFSIIFLYNSVSLSIKN